MVEFAEDNVRIIYSPALDLSGYDYSQEEAKQSFTEALHEFFRYTNNKNTLDKVLKELGWAIRGSKKNPKFVPEFIIKNALKQLGLSKKDFLDCI